MYSSMVLIEVSYHSEDSNLVANKIVPQLKLLPLKYYVPQIADFGDQDYYCSFGGKVPFKWTAPEVCHHLYPVLCN